jgi:tetratricopeptide (TPR) repeat protein
VIVVAVAVIAALGAAAAVALAMGSGGGGEAGSGPTTSKPLSGRPPLILELPGVEPGAPAAAVLKAANRLPAGDPRRAVAEAVAGYDGAHPGRAIGALEALPQGDAAVVLNLALAELWAGKASAAEASLRRTRRLDPYGFYGGRADDTLHPEQVRWYPPYFAPGVYDTSGSPAQVRARAEAHPDRADGWMALALKLEADDREGAIAEAQKAVQDDPTGVSPRVALAVLSYDKDRPAGAMGSLSQLQQLDEHNVEVRFHRGLLLFWLRLDDDALAEFKQVVADDPNGPYARLADAFVTQLSGAS